MEALELMELQKGYRQQQLGNTVDESGAEIAKPGQEKPNSGEPPQNPLKTVAA